MLITKNRIKFYLGGQVLEAANPWIPGSPHSRLLDMLLDGDPRQSLELCTGTGYVARQLAAARPDSVVSGIDISPEMLRLGRKYARRQRADNLTLIEGDACRLPFPDNSFDTVFAAFGLHELPTTVRRGAIAESARVLVPGGRFLVMDLDRPVGPGGLAMDGYLTVMEPADARGVIGDGLVDMLVAGGFGIESRERATALSVAQYVIAINN